MTTPSFPEARQAALDALARGDARQAFGHVHFHLANDPAIATDRDRWCEAFDLFARISEVLAGEALAAVVRQAVDEPDDVQALYDLGYELIEQGLPGIAATALCRANVLFPNQESILTELAVALESDHRCHDAAHVLREAPDLVEESFFCRYLLAYNALMSGELNEPRRLLPRLLQSEDPQQLFLARRIEGMLVRADALRDATPLDSCDLRGWHLVVTGGLLLHLSPFGFDEGMRGRYAYTQDGPERCLEGLRRLAAVLDAWQLRLSRVWRLEDTDSAALALAAGQVLGCPVQPWPAGGSPQEGLIAVYDLGTLAADTVETLREHRPGQVLWSHASCWTQEPAFAADLTTYLHQYNVPPWGERLRINPETRETEKVPPSTAPAEERAAEIVAATLEADALADVPRLLELAQAARRLAGDHAPGAVRRAGPRCRQGTNSPVPSSRFL
jgi:hypothetical protein